MSCRITLMYLLNLNFRSKKETDEQNEKCSVKALWRSFFGQEDGVPAGKERNAF
jgi:hypothetical protein